MEPGTLIATRGSGTRLVELRYETTVDGVDYGIVVGPTGATGTPTPIVAALAKGYWERPDAVVKHGSHDQSSHGRRFASSVDPAVAAKAIRLVGENGGLSIKMTDGAEPTAGFMVARDSKKFGTAVTADEFYGPEGGKILGEFVVRNRANLASGKAYLGVWHQKTKIVDGVEIDLDRKDQIVHLDVTDNVPSRERAIRLGRRRDQISIWDVANFEEIQTGGSGAEVNKRDPLGRDPEGTGRHERRRNHGMGGNSPRGLSGSGQVRAVVVRFEPGLVPVLKHLSGKHDQKTHAHGGSTISPGLVSRAPTRGRPEANPIDGPDGTDWNALPDDIRQGQIDAVIAAYPHLAEGDGDPIDAITRNVVDAYDQASPQSEQFGERWYAQAHNDAEEIARTNGMTVEQGSAVLSALSPQTAWEPNVRWGHYMAEKVKENPVIDDSILDATVTKNKQAKTVREWLAEESTPRSITSGKKLSELSIDEQADVLSLMGQIDGQKIGIGPRLTLGGGVSDADYGTAPPLRNGMRSALKIMQPGDRDQMRVISEELNGHKTRSFYDAIVTAGQTRAVTIDVHALDAAVIGYSATVSGGKAKKIHGVDPAAVLAGVGAQKFPEYGASGTYALFAEGFRRATDTVNAGRAQRGLPELTPAQVQAIAWIATLPTAGR